MCERERHRQRKLEKERERESQLPLLNCPWDVFQAMLLGLLAAKQPQDPLVKSARVRTGPRQSRGGPAGFDQSGRFEATLDPFHPKRPPPRAPAAR